MNKQKNHLSKNRGFTLVELIVVLVILAILAAILVPTLIGYIREAKIKRYLPNAQACREAAQAAFVEQYALNGDVPAGTPVISGAGETSPENNSNNDDQDVSNTDFAKGIIQTAGVNPEPYLFMVAVGSNAGKKGNNAYTSDEATEKYTIYYCVYLEQQNTPPLYYYNNEWSTKDPHQYGIFDSYNVVKSGPLKGKRMQYYVISNKTGKSVKGSLWNYLKKDLYNEFK
ncbi:MAG: type II secretion system GspH family protein [Lachnospiraceae bacterium]|nr:type II secretion system GspH family protein [Lachnospiraceae bacterium]